MIGKLKIVLTAMVLFCGIASATPVEACPMCQVANQDDTNHAADARPRAYMYSILFMLAMPATLFSFFGLSFYRLSKKQARLNEEMLAAEYRDHIE